MYSGPVFTNDTSPHLCKMFYFFEFLPTDHQHLSTLVLQLPCTSGPRVSDRERGWDRGDPGPYPKWLHVLTTKCPEAHLPSRPKQHYQRWQRVLVSGSLDTPSLDLEEPTQGVLASRRKGVGWVPGDGLAEMGS